MKIRYSVACLALLAWSAPAFAQFDNAVATVKDHFVQNQARYGASAIDLAELVVTDAYTSRRTNATYVYMKQAHNGIEVYNATAQAVVTSDNEIMAPHARFVSDIADRINTDMPSTGPEGAASSAARHLRSVASTWWVDSRLETDGPNNRQIDLDYFVFVPESATLVYFARDNGDVRLAWDIELDTKDKQHYFSVRVDAVSGLILDYTDQVVYDHWGTLSGPSREIVPNFRPIETNMGASSEPEYRVYALPCEDPTDCARTLVLSPADPIASSLGWHDDNSTSYTTTQGNNTHAYTDTDANNVPDPGSSPDGGGSLHFDFPIDLLMDPSTYQPASVTNLFYWNNIIHDVLYRYGFDEAAGNFQEDNLGNGGAGSDYVFAEAQDGGGSCNANFSTPADGGNGRMQMFTCPSGVDTLNVSFPPSIAGDYIARIGAFGPQDPPDSDVDGDIELVDDGSAEPSLGCGPLVGFTPGNIALIRRGTCQFGTKSLNAQTAGAIGVIIYNNVGDAVLVMGGGVDGGSVTIPAYMVFESTGLAIESELPGTVTVSAFKGESFTADGDLDNGIVIHEYGHGISNRLTGGPGNVGCLGNQEQMGEGWSDFYGVGLTIEVGDSGTDPRGVGAYGLATPGGIRPAPYSTDFGINDFTYGDSRTAIVPHGVGHVWATAIWEMMWELIDAHGFDPDVYDAGGTAGNQIALSLVTEGMKLQPCSPGFVDGRDAILDADTLLYGGANSDLLWAAFARRGLGAFADQGSSSTNADNVEDFTIPGQMVPIPGVDTTFLNRDVQEGQTRDATVIISNTGTAELTWSLSLPPSWLSYSPDSGSVPAGGSEDVTFTFDAGVLPIGTTVTTTETFSTNATGGGASIDIDVQMNVILFVANEGEMDFPGTHLLSEVYPNPFNPTTTFTLAVAEPQDVHIALFDVLGRQITLLNNGPLAGRTNYQFTIDGRGLTSGTYFVRIAGETFADSHRITLLK